MSQRHTAEDADLPLEPAAADAAPTAPALPAGVAALLWLAPLVAGSAWLSMEVSRLPGSIATIWYANAIAAAWLSAVPVRQWAWPLVATAVGVLAGNLLWGVLPSTALRFVPANVLEAALAAALLRRAGLVGSDLGSPSAMTRLLLAGAIAPQLAGATLGALMLGQPGWPTFASAWQSWFEGSVVGAVSAMPLAFLLVHRGRRAVMDDCLDARLLVLGPLAVAVSLLVLARVPYAMVYVSLPLLLGAAMLRLGAVALLTLALSLTMAVALAVGLWVPPPMLAQWQQVFVYLAIVAVLVPSLVLASTMSSLNAHRQRLRQRSRELTLANQGLEQFVHIAAHDLREPLNTITQFGGLLQEDEGRRLSPSGLKYLNTVVAAAARMRHLLDDVLGFVRLQQAGGIELTEVALAETLDAVRLALAHRLNAPGVNLTVGPLPAVRGQHSLLVLLFQNLVGNALKFVPPGRAPRVEVSAVQVGPMVAITVTDNGIGIAQADLPRLFQPFQRLNVRRLYDGTGLGLVLARQIAELHGGSIYVSSHPGEGSRFTVVLPLA